MKIVLASASPRRREILNEIVDDFDVITTNADENFTEKTPYDNVIKVACNKAKSIDREKDMLVIGSDTTVYMDGKYYNKPENPIVAKEILKELNGKTHTVYTGVCILYNDYSKTFYDSAEVELKEMSDKDIDNYIVSGSPLDKAGAYGIQDKGIVKSFKGYHSTIMGLPKEILEKELREIINGD